MTEPTTPRRFRSRMRAKHMTNETATHTFDLYNRIPSGPVEAVKITKENMPQVANWANAPQITPPNGVPYLQLDSNPNVPDKLSRAFEGDWVLKQTITGFKGKPDKIQFKMYKDHAFTRLHVNAALDPTVPVEISDDLELKIYDEVRAAIAAYTGGDSTDEETARQAAQRVVVLARGDGKTEIIPTPDTSTFFVSEEPDANQ